MSVNTKKIRAMLDGIPEAPSQFRSARERYLEDITDLVPALLEEIYHLRSEMVRLTSGDEA